MKFPKLPKVLKRDKNPNSLSYHEFRISQNKSIFKKYNELSVFLAFLPKYFLKKLKKILDFGLKLINSFFYFFKKVKSFITIKLIWGRGRLSRLFINVSTLILISLVFLTGGFFRKDLIIFSKTDTELYTTSKSDIVTQAIIISDSKVAGSVRDTNIVYTVASGDTLSTIGKKFGVSVDTIRYANTLVSISSLKVGQVLTIPPVTGIPYTVKSKDTISSIAKNYSISEQAIADFNYLIPPFALKTGDKLFLPDASIPKPVAPTSQLANISGTFYDSGSYVNIPLAKSGKKGTGKFLWPTDSHYISQGFKFYHPGIDIAKFGPIYSADAGVVIRSGWWAGGYGFAVQVDHRNGFVTTYAHMSKLLVNVKDEVKKGEKIGLMGTTGNSTGVHLHFTIQQNGKFINPLSFY